MNIEYTRLSLAHFSIILAQLALVFVAMNTFHIARSELYAHQAFRFAKSVYGLQFHIECTKAMLAEWMNGMPDKEQVIAETERIFDEYKGRAMQFYRAFFLH